VVIGANYMQRISAQRDSNAWILQTWISFVLSTGLTTVGVLNLPVDIWAKGFVGMGLAFSVGSTFSLAKTQRDLHESTKLTSKIEEAKVEQILSQHGGLK
jgi:hypothetical protein